MKNAPLTHFPTFKTLQTDFLAPKHFILGLFRLKNHWEKKINVVKALDP